MSKGKKTIEDLLEEGLVPEEEQPYEIPENWIWVKLKIINKNRQRNIEPNKFKDETFELYSVPSYPSNSPEIVKGEEVGSNKQLVTNNEVLLCKINPRINRVWKVSDNKGKFRQLASTEWIVISENRIVYANYLLYLFKSPYFRKLITSNVSGVGGSLTRARPKEVETYPIAIPPFNEQIRIAEKVERLLDKIDEATLLIEEAKETFELRRASILNKAFRGELTDSADGLNRVEGQPYSIPNNWGWKSFNDVAKVCSNLVDPKLHQDLPHIAPDNIEKGTGQLLDYQTIEESKVKSPKHYFYNGQILYSKIRPYLSKVILAKFDGLCSADMYPIETNLETNYLYWYMLSAFFVEKASTAGSRSVLPKINQKELGNIPVPVPPIETQRRIVRIIEKTLLQEKQSIGFVEDTIKNMEKLKESILSKAFRGELGTTDLSEGNAIELLKEALQEQLK